MIIISDITPILSLIKAGRLESLVLYGEKKADLLLIDERKGRNSGNIKNIT